MGRVEGAIYAPGSDPSGNGNTSLVSPYQQYQQHQHQHHQHHQHPLHSYNTNGYNSYGPGGHGGGGYGTGNGHSHMMTPLPPPCDSREGSALLNRGIVKIEWANTGVSMPLGKLLGAEPGVQDNLIAWGSDSAYRFAAPPPPAPAPAPAPAAFLAPPPPKDEDEEEDDDDDDDDDGSQDEKEEGKKCDGPACPKVPQLLSDIRQIVVDRREKGRKERKKNKGKAEKTKWLCWNCCWFEHGYPAAAKAWSKAKRS